MYTEIRQNSIQARTNIIKHEGTPFLLCDWLDFVLVHYEVDAKALQNTVPFELDLFEEKAYVSLVAFTLENFSFAQNGMVQSLAMMPIRTHRYFNVRTYIKHRHYRSIYFIKEWISNQLCAIIGSKLYGLPCEHGRLDYSHQWAEGLLQGEVMGRAQKARYQYQIHRDSTQEIGHVKAHSLEEFLFERYMAVVEKNGVRKYFRIWHEAWRQATVEIREVNDHLIPMLGHWGENLKPVKAHYSPGVYGVWMGKPLTLE